MIKRNTVLLIEDDENMSKYVTDILKKDGYSVISTNQGKEGENILSSHLPEIVLLNIGLPDTSGIEVLKNIRKWSNVPVIILSGKKYERDKILALDSGADDYITKPFSQGEFLARIRVALRHSRINFDDEIMRTKKFYSKDLVVDFNNFKVYVSDREIDLTLIEFKIIELLCKYSGKVLTYDFILKNIWGPNVGNDNKILRVNMANIRKKIEKDTSDPEYIKTQKGVGYIMIEADYEHKY